MQTIVYFINKNNRKTEILVNHKVYAGNNIIHHIVEPGDTIKLGDYMNAETFIMPEELFAIQVRSGKNKRFTPVDFSEIPSKRNNSDPQILIFEYFWF